MGDCDFNEVFQTAILNYDGADDHEKPFGEEILEYDEIVVHGLVSFSFYCFTNDMIILRILAIK